MQSTNLGQSTDCTSGAIRTNEAFLYGRFEVRMKSAAGDGVVSSFFMYNADAPDCSWPAQNNEIDIEMTGNNLTVQFTTHLPPLPGQTVPYSITHDQTYGFDPHADMHDYAIEWEPTVIRWFIDGVLAHTESAAWVSDMMHPQRIHMNLWAAAATSWVGVWDNSILPVQSEYDFVRAYAYTPGSGTSGTGNNYSLLWTDDFNTVDFSRWEISEFGGFTGNYCSFESTAVDFDSGILQLQIEVPVPSAELIPTTFSVDATAANLGAGDVIYLNGGFNSWCGSCEPMTLSNGIWSKTLVLPPGEYEYIFTKNGWSDIGQPAPNSSCDYKKCDGFYNYGFTIPHGSGSIQLPTYCWDECTSCDSCPADIDGNGLITVNDFLELNSRYGLPCICSEDIDGNGFVNVNDFLELNSAFGTNCL